MLCLPAAHIALSSFVRHIGPIHTCYIDINLELILLYSVVLQSRYDVDVLHEVIYLLLFLVEAKIAAST